MAAFVLFNLRQGESLQQPCLSALCLTGVFTHLLRQTAEVRVCPPFLPLQYLSGQSNVFRFIPARGRKGGTRLLSPEHFVYTDPLLFLCTCLIWKTFKSKTLPYGASYDTEQHQGIPVLASTSGTPTLQYEP